MLYDSSVESAVCGFGIRDQSPPPTRLLRVAPGSYFFPAVPIVLVFGLKIHLFRVEGYRFRVRMRSGVGVYSSGCWGLWGVRVEE